MEEKPLYRTQHYSRKHCSECNNLLLLISAAKVDYELGSLCLLLRSSRSRIPLLYEENVRQRKKDLAAGNK
jgi:hypothetical protein